MASKDLTYKLEPFNHQHQAIDQAVDLLQRTGGAPLFLSMGLGKTATAIHCARWLVKQNLINKILIICPKNLRSTWIDELETHATKVPPIIVWDPVKYKTKKYQEKVRRQWASQSLVIGITNIDAFSGKNSYFADFLGLFLSHSTYCILDESTSIKNPKSQRTKNILKISPQLSYRSVLTGTEITNSVLDIYSQMQFCRPDFWEGKSYYQFRSKYAILERQTVTTRGRLHSFDVVVGYRKIDKLMNKVDAAAVRMNKDEVFDMPEKLPIKFPIELSPSEKKMYKQLIDDWVMQHEGEVLTVEHVLTMTIRARQFFSGVIFPDRERIAKKEAFLQEMEEIGEKTIVWCSFTAEIEMLHKLFADRAVAYYGAMNTDQRERAKDRFKNDDSVQLFIAQPKIAAHGLNLQYCTLQYFYSFGPSVEIRKQAEDRSHRIGTVGVCRYKTLYVQDTIEEKMYHDLMKGSNIVDKFRKMDVDGVRALLYQEANL